MSGIDLLIHTKLRLPFTRSILVSRPQLQSRIEDGLRGLLTLVIAPPGFGKTTLVAACVSSIGKAVAWLSLDKNDNQTGSFLTYLLAAFQEVDQTIGDEASRRLAASLQEPSEITLISLINDLDSRNNEIILVLDDYQFISSQAVHEQMAFLLEHCPQSLHIVIVSRSDPPLPFARLRARGQIVELRAAELSFNKIEAARFLSDVMGLKLDTRSVSLLEERTEGWIAGLQMAALSMRNRKDVTSFIADFSGTNRYILDYLVEEILDNLPQHIQRFLLSTSILDRFNAALCDTVIMGRSSKSENNNDILLIDLDSQAILSYLENANIFLIPLDDKRNWYRYHHLFASLLQARLVHLQDIDERNLHWRAADWFEQNGFPEYSIHHALLARDFPRAVRLIESQAETVWLKADYYRLIEWVKALPTDLVGNRPWLCIWYAWSVNQTGLLKEARAWIDMADRAVAKSNQEPDGSSTLTPNHQAIEYEIAILYAHLACLAQDYDQAVQLASKVLESSPPDNKKASLIARSHVLHALGSLYYTVGELDKSEEVSLATIAAASEIGFVVRHIHAVNKLVHVYRTQGQLQRANNLLQQTVTTFEQQGLARYSVLHILHCRMIDILYEANRLEEIEHLIEASGLAGSLTQVPYIAVDLYNMETRQHLLNNDTENAQRKLDAANKLINESYIWPALTRQTELLQLRLWLYKGNIQQAIDWDHTPLDKDADRFPFLSEYRLISRARIRLSQGKWGEALDLLNQVQGSAESGGRYGSLINILLVKAQAYHSGKQMKEAIDALEAALGLAEGENYIRTFIDEGTAIGVLLKEAGKKQSAHRQYARHLLTELERSSVPVQDLSALASTTYQNIPPESLIVEPLSQREQEVLQLIALGFSNAQVASQLVVSPGTVKAHTASIYRKLDVANRTEAVARARQLGILS